MEEDMQPQVVGRVDIELSDNENFDYTGAKIDFNTPQ